MNKRIAREIQRFQALRFKQLVKGLMKAGEKVERRDNAKKALNEQIKRVKKATETRNVEKEKLRSEFLELDKKLGDHIDSELDTRLLKEEGILGKLKQRMQELEGRVKKLESELEQERNNNKKLQESKTQGSEPAKPSEKLKASKKNSKPKKSKKAGKHEGLLEKIKKIEWFIAEKEESGVPPEKLKDIKEKLKQLKKQVQSDKKRSKKRKKS